MQTQQIDWPGAQVKLMAVARPGALRPESEDAP